VIIRCTYLQVGNPHWTLDQILALQPLHNAMLARLIKAYPNASITSLAFCGLRDEYGASAIEPLGWWVRAEHAAMPPGTLKPIAGEEFMEPWKVTPDENYSRTIQPGMESLFKAAIGNGVDVVFEIAPDSTWHLAVYKDKKLQNRSGLPRHVEIKG